MQARSIPFAAGLLIAASAAFAQQLPDADTEFVKQAAQNGWAEVESGKLAQQKAQSPEVKDFAQMMVTEHTKANQELTALVQDKGVELPKEPSMIQKGQMKLLGTKDGKEFDQAYVEQMGMKAHQDTVALFEKGARESKDPQVKAYATKTLPKIRMHLDHAKKLQASTAGAGR